MNVTAFRKDILNCLNKLEDGVPLRITNKDNSYIVMKEQDYSAFQETIYLMQDPVVREMIMTPSDEIAWYKINLSQGSHNHAGLMSFFFLASYVLVYNQIEGNSLKSKVLFRFTATVF